MVLPSSTGPQAPPTLSRKSPQRSDTELELLAEASHTLDDLDLLEAAIA
jgi:hypothetical protein